MLVAAALWGCGTSFEGAAWKAEAAGAATRYDSRRAGMIGGLRRILPAGTPRSFALRTLGPSEARYDDLCRETLGADECLIYHAGASGVDPPVVIVASRSGRVLEVRAREL